MQGRYRGLEDGRGYTPNPNPNSGYRNFNNRSNTSYNRSSNFNRRPYLPPPPPSKHEILMRAGKLAAEYLVSQGLLDPEKLPHNRGQNGKLKEFEGLKYGKEDDDGGNEADYGPSEYYRERESGFDQLLDRSENTMESRSENQDLAEDGGSKTSSLSLKKDASNEMVGDNVVADSEVSKEVRSDADYDSKKETTEEDNNNGDDDDVMEATVQENINIELKEEEKEIDAEEKSINKRKRENEDLPISNVKAKESSLDEEIEAPLEIMEEKIEDEIDGKIEEEEKQISSEPFKECDHDLMHGNEVAENDKGDEISVNIELDAISNNGNGSGEFDRMSNDNDDKAVQVSNLEVDVAMDGSRFDPSNPEEEDTIREEPIYPNIDSFLNQHEHADLNCIHDGYSLDFPNFLGSDITGCPPTDLNNLGSEMEGLPNDDDSIYVSFAEIPIGFMEVWDPPSQDYGKFF